MKYKEVLNNLKSWISVIQKSILIITAIEAIIVIIIGVASSNLYNITYSKFWISSLIFFGIIYVLITVLKIAYNSKFPSSIIDDLISKKDLETAIDDISRKDAINSYISQTIVDLSRCKCQTPILKKEDDWVKESDKDFLRELKSLTETFSRVLNVLLNTTNIKFTAGIYASSFRAIKSQNKPDTNSGIFLFRDDHSLSKFSRLKKLMGHKNASGIELEIQTLIRSSLNNGTYETKEFTTSKDTKILMICINIQELTDNHNQKGVLFILTNPIAKIPNDLESVLRMFSNILSHWLDLYIHEVRSRQIEIISEDVEKENTDAGQGV